MVENEYEAPSEIFDSRILTLSVQNKHILEQYKN